MNNNNFLFSDYFFGKPLWNEVKRSNALNLEDIFDISTFKLKDDIYTATLIVGPNVTYNMIDVEVSDEKRTVTISYSYDDKGTKFSSAITEMVPVDGDISTMDATFENGKIILTMNKIVKSDIDKSPKTILIKHK